MCHADRLFVFGWFGWLFMGLRTSGVLYAGAIELVEIPVAGAPRDVLVIRGRDARTRGTRVRACACAGGAACQQSACSCAQGCEHAWLGRVGEQLTMGGETAG